MAKKDTRLLVPMTIEWSGKGNRKHFLRYLIQTNNFKFIAELGVNDGRTTFALLKSCPNIEKYYAIDLSTRKFYNSDIKKEYPNLIAINGNTTKVSDHIPDKSLDLVFIDANHSYEFVKQDILKYRPKLKSGGVLSGHDINFLGVNKAVNECVINYDVGPNNVWFTKV